MGSIDNDLLLDPSTLKENQYNKRGLIMALNARKEQFDSRKSKVELFQVLVEWATKTWPTSQIRQLPPGIPPAAGIPIVDPKVGNKRPTFSTAFESPAKIARPDRFAGRFHSPGNTDVVIESFDKVWENSFSTIFPYLTDSANTSHLEITTAGVLNPWDIIFLYGNDAFYLYAVGIQSDGSFVATLISHMKSGPQAPFERSRLDPSMPCLRLSRDSITYFKEFQAHSPNFAVAWPAEAHVPPRTVDLTDSSRPNLPGVAGGGGPSLNQLPSVSHVAPPSVDPAGIPRRPSGLGWSLDASMPAEALYRLEDIKTNKHRCPRGHDLTEEAARIFSTTPSTVLNTGVVQTYRLMFHYVHWTRTSDDPATNSTYTFWGIQHWRVQLQPHHLLLLIQDIMRVDIRLFACMTAVMALSETETLGTRLMDGVDKLTDHVPNVHIVAGSLDRLGRCITNFGFTLSILFRLAQSVQEALRDLCTSAFRHAATYNFGPADPEAPLVYFYIANRLQYFVASCFRQVLIGATNTREGLVAALRIPFPDVSPYSQFSADIMGIRGAGRHPSCLPPGAPTIRKTLAAVCHRSPESNSRDAIPDPRADATRDTRSDPRATFPGSGPDQNSSRQASPESPHSSTQTTLRILQHSRRMHEERHGVPP